VFAQPRWQMEYRHHMIPSLGGIRRQLD
jgi:hypothetical protein